MRPILTADAMRAAEQMAIDDGVTVEMLMERAGAALAEAVWRFAGCQDTLVLAGPGNNGGDGYVAARYLSERGVKVRVAALSDSKSRSGQWARRQWGGDVEALTAETAPAPVLIDALFGTGLRRGLDASMVGALFRLADTSTLSITCDLPSGVEADTGEELSAVPAFEMTVTFGALKPAHRLYPAMRKCGRVVMADIGVQAVSQWHEIGWPPLPPLDPAGHKYDRGMVHCIAGTMPGAIALAATAALRGGAGYVRIESDKPVAKVPAAVVQGQVGGADDPRLGAVLVGPGLGVKGGQFLDRALESGRPLVLDGDAIGLLCRPERLKGLDAIVTPHAREFDRLFGPSPASKPRRALDAARASGAVVVFKGPDTVVATPHGQLGFAPPAPTWLATAGSGDVLAGLVAAMRARGLEPFEAACAAVWLHGRAAEIAGRHMIADDLPDAIPGALSLLDA